MQNRLFRKSALEQLSSPEQLDTLMKVTQPRGWLTLIVIVLVFAALGVWAAVASIPVTVTAEGELLDNAGTMSAVVYVRAADAQALQPGMTVQITPITVSPQEYGYLLGTINRIDAQPTDDVLARNIFTQEAAYAVHIDLQADPDTPTGYRWSIGTGPDVVLRSDIAISGEIVVDEKRPLSLVFPGLE